MLNAKDARLMVDNHKKDKLNLEIRRVEQAITEAVKRGDESVMVAKMTKECELYLKRFCYKVRYYGQGYAEDNGYIIEW